MFVEINFSNFSEVQDQFNCLGSDYLTGAQIMEDITKQVNQALNDGEVKKHIEVTVEPKNFDSAWACFSLIGYVNKGQDYSFIYEYNGTAK